MARAKSKTSEVQGSPPGTAESPNIPVSVGESLVSSLADGLEAFYAGEYEEAIARFEAVLNDASSDENAKAKAAYWQAEALLQREYTPDKVAHFERVAERHATHYLGAAAQRRAEALKSYFSAFTREP